MIPIYLKKYLKIDGYHYEDFLLGSSKPGWIKRKDYFHLPMPIHFVIKHRNQGKIESHKWFFKGFCDYINPKYAQILDCGSICLWDSLSYIVKYLDQNEGIGAWAGEVEVMVTDK